MKKGTLTEAMFIRMSPEMRSSLDELSARVPAMPRAALAREAMRLGLDLLREDPARLILPAPTRRKDDEQ